MDRIEKEWVNDEWGLVGKWAPNIAGRGVGVVHNNIGALTAFLYGKADLGLKLMRLSAKAPLQETMLGAFDETMPGGGDTIQLWSFGPYLEDVIGGLVGVHPVAAEHFIEIYPQMPEHLTSYSLHNLKVGSHTLGVEWRRQGSGHILKIAHPGGPQDLTILLRIDRKHAQTIEVNGKVVSPKQETFRGMETATATISLSAGRTATVRLME